MHKTVTLYLGIMAMFNEGDDNAVYCRVCKQELHPLAACTCTCGEDLQQAIWKKFCVLCQNPMPITTQDCVLCSAPQNLHLFQQKPKKKCVNPQCGVELMMVSLECYKCTVPQPQQSHDYQGHTIQEQTEGHSNSEQQGTTVQSTTDNHVVSPSSASPFSSVNPQTSNKQRLCEEQSATEKRNNTESGDNANVTISSDKGGAVIRETSHVDSGHTAGILDSVHSLPIDKQLPADHGNASDQQQLHSAQGITQPSGGIVQYPQQESIVTNAEGKTQSIVSAPVKPEVPNPISNDHQSNNIVSPLHDSCLVGSSSMPPDVTSAADSSGNSETAKCGMVDAHGDGSTSDKSSNGKSENIETNASPQFTNNDSQECQMRSSDHTQPTVTQQLSRKRKHELDDETPGMEKLGKTIPPSSSELKSKQTEVTKNTPKDDHTHVPLNEKEKVKEFDKLIELIHVFNSETSR